MNGRCLQRGDMNGVIYFLCGNWQTYLGPLCVSLHSLRQRYDGPICLMIGDDIDLESLPFRFQGESYRRVPLATVCRHKHYVTKASLWRHSPFGRTLLLDADTVVTGDISDLFQDKVVVTKFSDWVSTGKRIGGRIKQWRNVTNCGHAVDRLLSQPWPAINTGVVSWNRGNALLKYWEQLSQEGWRCSFTDELAMQLFIPGEDYWNFELFDDSWNCSPTYGVNRDNARIWHYHGRRMVRKPGCREMYRLHLQAALDANAHGIAEWLEELDPALWSVANGQ